MLSTFTWDPQRYCFVIPYLDHPVTWYGLFFAGGFVWGYFLFRVLLRQFFIDKGIPPKDAETQAMHLIDRMTFFTLAGAVLGARLGHVFFYDWSHYRQFPTEIWKVWEGGLASHGAALGLLLAFVLGVWRNRKEYPLFRFLVLLDLIALPAALAGGCIRLGNFVNQEITGVPTSLPWGVIFGHPLDGIPGIPLHPVQLYEAAFYFAVGGGLWWLWKHKEPIKQWVGTGWYSGLFCIGVFAFRFLIEPCKAAQNLSFDTTHWLTVGQCLSLPFLLLGGILLGGALRRQWRRA